MPAVSAEEICWGVSAVAVEEDRESRPWGGAGFGSSHHLINEDRKFITELEYGILAKQYKGKNPFLVNDKKVINK